MKVCPFKLIEEDNDFPAGTCAFCIKYAGTKGAGFCSAASQDAIQVEVCENVCQQCFVEYKAPNVAFWEPDGFCSDYCLHQYEKEFLGLDEDEEEE